MPQCIYEEVENRAWQKIKNSEVKKAHLVCASWP
jgi:hypothetical protein